MLLGKKLHCKYFPEKNFNESFAKFSQHLYRSTQYIILTPLWIHNTNEWMHNCNSVLQTLSHTITKSFKSSLSDVRLFLSAESPLKMMKNVFCLMLKAFFDLEILTFLSWLFDHVGKRLDYNAKVYFKIYDVRDWTASN